MSQVRTPIIEGDGDSRHGSENGYGNLSCRCTRCTRAHADYWTERREKPRTRGKHVNKTCCRAKCKRPAVAKKLCYTCYQLWLVHNGDATRWAAKPLPDITWEMFVAERAGRRASYL